MRRVAGLLLWTSLSVMAQFSSLAVTDDGGQVYFLSTRPLKSERSRIQPASGLYRIERQADGVYSPPMVFRAPSATTRPEIYVRSRVGTTGDGTAIVWNEARRPVCGSLCNSLPYTYTTTLAAAGSDKLETYSGLGRISRNGRYLVSAVENVLVDLAQKTRVPVSLAPNGTPVDDALGVTSDGQVLVRVGEDLAIWTPSGHNVIAKGVYDGSAVISDNGRTVAYIDRQKVLSAVDRASGRILFTAADSRDPSLSNSGGLLLFAREVNGEKQVFVADLAGDSRARQLTFVQGGVGAAVLAGFGAKAFAVIGRDGDLAEIDILSGISRRLIAGPPNVSLNDFPFVAPGSVGDLGPQFDGHLLVNGRRTTPLGNGLYQIPWDAEPGTTAELQVDSESPFGEVATSTVRLRAPKLPNYAASYHFRPGQLVSFWGYGLGRVTPYVPEGQTSPMSPLSHLLDPLRCVVVPPGVDPGRPAEVLFAGLAPGMTAVYQLNIRLPETIPDFGLVRCDFDTPWAFVVASYRRASEQ